MGPETRYALTADGLHIGYQIVGSGDLDLVFVPYDYSNIEASWDLNWFASFVGGLGSLARVLLFDRRGSGTSDRLGAGPSPPIEAQMDDIRAVMDAAGSKRACLFGIESGAALCLVFAATYPERTAGVVVFGGSVRGSWAPDYPWGWTDHEYGTWSDRVNREWASPKFVEFMAGWLSPTLAHDERFRASLGRLLRLSASPGDATARDRTVRDTDVRHILPTVHVPTLVIHRTDDKVEPVEEGRYIAEHIPGATFIELPGADHIFPLDDLVPHIGRFIEIIRTEQGDFDRVLATVLFTDIVGSTERAAVLGDRAWGELLDRHHSAVRALFGRYRGKEIDNAGDGFLATFDGPARAIRCGRAIVDSVKSLGIEIRAGCHTGEVQLDGNTVRGIAVHIGARVGALAGASEVLVSSTVKDLVAGSELAFEPAGEHELKGLPGRWQLYRVAG